MLRRARARKHPEVRVEVAPPTDQPWPTADVTDRLDSGRDAKGRLVSSATASAMAKLPRRSHYLKRQFQIGEEFKPHNAARIEWVKRRLQDMHNAHGHVSHGVGGMLNSAGWAYATAECLYERFARTGSAEDARAAALQATTARQHELAAWELCAREAQNRSKKKDPANELANLLDQPAETTRVEPKAEPPHEQQEAEPELGD